MSFKYRYQLDTAIALWISDEDSAIATYGDINNWDVSAITDFSYLFQDKSNFNSDIGNWNVSNGENFCNMFDGATSFNQDISGWDVSSGSNFSFMFYGATSFNKNLDSFHLSVFILNFLI